MFHYSANINPNHLTQLAWIITWYPFLLGLELPNRVRHQIICSVPFLHILIRWWNDFPWWSVTFCKSLVKRRYIFAKIVLSKQKKYIWQIPWLSNFSTFNTLWSHSFWESKDWFFILSLLSIYTRNILTIYLNDVVKIFAFGFEKLHNLISFWFEDDRRY